MVNVLTWVFWLSFAVILLSELKFWDVLRGEEAKKNQRKREKKPESKK